jgi:hypothetical protein
MLAALLNTPRTQDDWDRWSWHHLSSHTAIRQAIVAQKKIRLAEYILYPVNFGRLPDFLQANSQSHIDMLGVLGIQSEDLQDVDIRDQRQLQAWSWIHYLDHYNAENALNISS